MAEPAARRETSRRSAGLLAGLGNGFCRNLPLSCCPISRSRLRQPLRGVSLSRVPIAVLLHIGLQAWAAVLVSSLLFGRTQLPGARRMVMTLLIGLVLGSSRLAYESLVPAIFLHSAVDVVAGAAGPRY